MTVFFPFLCMLLSTVSSPIILVLMIIELGIGVIVVWRLMRLRKEINKLNASEQRINQKSLRENRGKITTSFESIVVKDWNSFDAFLGRYQKELVSYSFFSLLIQLFPFLGILGTVASLYIFIDNGQDIYAAVRTALSPTLYGIICTAIFKIVDIFLTARLLNYIDDGIDRYAKNYESASQGAQTKRTNAPSSRIRSSATQHNEATAYSSNIPAKRNSAKQNDFYDGDNSEEDFGYV